MSYWFVIHSLQAFNQHSDLIGCGKSHTNVPTHKIFREIKKGDKIVYYARGDKVIVGIFSVISDMEYKENDQYWGNTFVFRLKPEIMPPNGRVLDFKSLVYDPKIKFDLFSDKEGWMYQLWGRVVRKLSQKDFRTIESRILKMKYEPSKNSISVSEKIGEAIGKGLLFTPVDEMGVVFLFSKYHQILGFPHVIKIQQAFPDVVAIDKHGQQKYIELEFKSSGFKQHLDSKEKCDVIVCWEDDWNDMPENIRNTHQIIPLKEALADLLEIPNLL